MVKKGVRIIKNGEPSRFLTGDDVLVTNVSSHTGETVDEALDSIASTLDDHQTEIDKLKSNVKYIYSYGGVGGKGSGGSGGSQIESARFFASLADHQMIADSVNAIVLPGPGEYPIDISVGNSGGQTYYVKTDVSDNFKFAKTEALSIEKNQCMYQKMVTLNENGTIIVEFYDPEGFRIQRIEQRYIVNPHTFDMKFMYKFNNQDLEFNSKNEYFIGDASYNDPYIDLYFKIDVTGVTNISIDYSIGDTDEIEGDDEYMSGQGVKNDFTSTDISQKNDHFRIPLNKLKRNGVKFTDESNTGTYTVTASLTYMVNGVPTDPDVRTFKITLIPGYLYINVSNPQDLLYDTPEDMLAAKAIGEGGIPEKNLSVGAYTSFYCKVFEGPMRTTARPYVVYLTVYDCSIVDNQIVPAQNPVGNVEEMSVNEQQEMSIPFSVSFGTTGIKKLSFTTNGRKDDIPDTGVPVEKYIYISEPTSTISWYPSKKNEQGEEIELIRHNNFYFRANSGEEKTYSKNISGEQTFPTLRSGYAPLEMSVTDEPIILSDPSWNPSQNYDTTILSFGMQFSTVNSETDLILEVFSPNNDNADIQLTSKTLFDKDTKKICIPPEENFNKAINSQYHLIQIVRTRIGYISTTPKYATYLYIDGKLESNDPSGQNYGSLYVDKIKLHNVNVVYNLINLQFVLMDETTDYTVDGLIYQYYLAYKEIMQQKTISDAELVIFNNLNNIKFNGENTIVDYSTVRNIAPFMLIPTIMMEATELPENLETFKENMFKGYGNGDSLFGTKTINLYWCNPEKDSELKQIEVLGIKDKIGTVYNGIWQVKHQGTSTMRNRIKNFSLILTTSNSSDPNKQILMSPNYDPNDGHSFLPEKIWTLKADIADSAHANNTSVGKFVNRVCTPFSRNLNFSTTVSKYIKNTLEGFPVLMFFKMGSEVYYFGVYNFNMGRNSYYNLGYHSDEETLEMISNIPEMQSSSLTFSIGSDNISNLTVGEVQENHAEFDFHQFDTSMLFTPPKTERDTMFGTDDKIEGGGVAKTTLSNFVEKVAKAGGYCFAKIGKQAVSSRDEDGDCGIRYNIREYTDDNGNTQFEEFVPDVSYQFHYDGKNKIWNQEPDPELTFDYLGRDVTNLLQCISIYDDEGGQHDDWNYLDFTSASEYYTICMAFGLVDSIVKNMNIKSWDNKKCYIAFYDMDCAFGEDNAGHEDVSYLAATDYWRSPIKNNYVDRVAISYDYWPQGGEKGFDYPSSYLFAIVKYAQPILSMLNITTTTLTNYPQQFWANMRMRKSSTSTVYGALSNADNFMSEYFSSGVNIIPAYLTSLNYQVKYLYYGKKLDKNGNELDEYDFLANQSAFNGTRFEKVREWLNKRLHFLDIVFNVQNIDTPIGGGCSIPKLDKDTFSELGKNPDVTILSDAFTGENGNAALINGQGSPVLINTLNNTPVIIVRGGFNDIYLLPGGTSRIKANATAKETYIVKGSKEFIDMSMIDPFLTTGYCIESDNLESINYGGMTFGPVSHQLSIKSTSVKIINLQIETWTGDLNINNSGLNGKAIHTINISKSGFTGTWTGLSNLKTLNISSVTNKTGKISISQCPLLSGENCIISGTSERPTTLDTLELMNVSGVFDINNTNIREITIVASVGSEAEFTINGDKMLRKLTLQNFKKVKIVDCPNLEELQINEPPANEGDHSKDVCESIIIEIHDYTPESGTTRYYLKHFNSNRDGVFDFTKYSKLKTIGLSGSDQVEVIKIPDHKVSVETFRDNINLEFVDTYGEESCIELTQMGTFDNCPHYGMRQSWYSKNSNSEDKNINTYTGVYSNPNYTKMSIKHDTGEDRFISLANTFRKNNANDVSKYLTTVYTNEWGQKVNNTQISIKDAAYFIDTFVGGKAIDNAYIYYDGKDEETGDDIYLIHDTNKTSDQKIFGDDCRANVTSFASCFYKQKMITYTHQAGASATLPDLSMYTSLVDISRMYYGTQVSYITSKLLSLPYEKNNNNVENALDWTEFIGQGEIKIERNALMNISYRIDSLSLIQPLVYEVGKTGNVLNVNQEDGYLDVLSILCPRKEDGSNLVYDSENVITDVTYDPVDIDSYIKFTRIKYITYFNINTNQYVDYSNLFKLCTEVTTLNNFLNCDLSRMNISGLLKTCTKLTSITDSCNHIGNVSELGYTIDLYEFFNWENLQNIQKLFECGSDDVKKISFSVKKTISNTNFFNIIELLNNYKIIKRLSNIFSYCTITGYSGDEIKFTDDMPGIFNINALFYHCNAIDNNGNDKPLMIRRSFFEHLPDVTLVANTFCGVHFDHMLSYDFFCKSYEDNDTSIYLKEGNSYVSATLHTTKFKSSLINSMYSCFKDAKFENCRCWFDVNRDFAPEDRHIPVRDVINNDPNITTYYRKEGASLYIEYKISDPTAYTDTLNNYTNYVPDITIPGNNYVINNHDIKSDLVLFNNIPSVTNWTEDGYVPFVENDFNIYPTYCCLPPDIFYGCYRECDLTNVFSGTNIIGVIPQHLLIKCYASSINNMFENVNILPNLIYHYNSRTETNEYLEFIDNIDIDEETIKERGDNDLVVCEFDENAEATVLFRNGNGELRRRRPIMGIHNYDSTPIDDLSTIYQFTDYNKSQFTYVPTGYVSNTNLQEAFTFRYNLPKHVDMYKQNLQNQGIYWPVDQGGNIYSPENRPDLWPYYTQYFFIMDESVQWGSLKAMSESFISNYQDVSFVDRTKTPEERVFSTNDQTYKNRWWNDRNNVIGTEDWDRYTNGIFNVFLNLCCTRDNRTGKIKDNGCNIIQSMRNGPNLENFVSGILTIFLNGMIFNESMDCAELTSRNGSPIISYTHGFGRNLILPRFIDCASPLINHPKVLLAFPPSMVYFYQFMFPDNYSQSNYTQLWNISSEKIKTTSKYILL